jgi:cell wall-associated NlpC family hydrolase
MANEPDRRITPARPDLAAARLKGQVEAQRFVEGAPHQVIASAAGLHRAPADNAMLDTQALFGDTFTVYDAKDGWVWGQMGSDSYVGWVRASELSAEIAAPTHTVAVLRTYVFSRQDFKSTPLLSLSLSSRVGVIESDGKWSRIAHGGWVYAAHLRPLSEHAADWVSEAEKFVGAPYLWGGKDSIGLDCSGLVQTAMASAGIAAPRDTDMQEAALGRPVTIDLGALKRGDLVFWNGHVGVMLDASRLLHANAHHMMAAIEPVRDAVARNEDVSGPVTSIRRTL